MSMKFEEAILAIEHWFRSNNLSTDSLTLILNFRDAREAGSLDCVLRHSIEVHRMIPYKSIDDLREFTMCGIKVRIESPIHADPR